MISKAMSRGTLIRSMAVQENPLATHVNRQGSMVVRGSNGDNPATPRDDRSLQTLPTIKILLSLLTG